jgi:Cu2+-exporting ATPase
MIAAPPTRGRTNGRVAGRPAPAPYAPCPHCGDPLGPRPVWSDEKAFCCTGCAVVYRALAEAGFDQTYYRLRDVSPGRPGARPAEPDSLAAQELDAPAFLAEHTRALDGGLRQVELFVDGVHCAACVWLVERMPY